MTAAGCVLMSVAVYIPNNFDDAAWIRYAAFLRLLRLFRLVRVLQLPAMLRFLYVMISVEHIRVFYETFLAMLPAATRLLKARAAPLTFVLLSLVLISTAPLWMGSSRADGASEGLRPGPPRALGRETRAYWEAGRSAQAVLV